MSRRKRSRTPFVLLCEEIYKSAAWRALPDSAVRLWIDLRTKNTGSNNGKITPTISTMRALGWVSKSKLSRALALLVEHGFIRYTRKSSPNAFHRASRIRFTDIPMPGDEREGLDGCGPTWDFLKWTAPKSDTSSRRFALPARRGGTAPAEGAQPPPQKGNGGPKPPPQKGNAKTPLSHRENGPSDDVARRSPSGGEVIGLAIPTPESDAPAPQPEAAGSQAEPAPGDMPIIRSDPPPHLRRKAERQRATKGDA